MTPAMYVVDADGTTTAELGGSDSSSCRRRRAYSAAVMPGVTSPGARS